jgi:hypothetical protein
MDVDGLDEAGKNNSEHAKKDQLLEKPFALCARVPHQRNLPM